MIRSVRNSWELYRESTGHLGCGSSILSKRPRFEDREPAGITRGKGCRVWDADGNQYIDSCNALGAVTLCHAIPEINRAVRRQLRRGVVYGRPHPLEGEVAALLSEVIPCAEKVRFFKTGADAIAVCIKIARHATGRKCILQCGYNGWLNTPAPPRGTAPPGVASGNPRKGVPPETAGLHRSLPWGKIEEWRQVFAEQAGETAAVVVACDYAETEAGAEFLPSLRDLTAEDDVLMIMDEIVTGFRVALGGAQERFGVAPNMAAFGKNMANGMPISAYAGKGDLLDSCAELSISTTFGGETLSLAAARAAMGIYRRQGVIGHLWETGKILWGQAAELLASRGVRVEIRGVPVCPKLLFRSQDEHEAFFRACVEQGLFLYHVPYVNFSHKPKDVRETLRRLERVAGSLAAANSKEVLSHA